MQYREMWTTETMFAVTGGMQYSMDLWATREGGNNAASCTGTFSVQVFTGMLP